MTIDPLRPPDTDEEPWLPADPELDGDNGCFSMFGLEDLAGWWVIVTAIVAAALVAVLVVLGIGRIRR